MAQAVGRDGFVVIAVGRLDAVAALLPPAQTFLLHEPGDAVASVAGATFAQLHHAARAAIGGAALGMDVLDLLWIRARVWTACGPGELSRLCAS